MRIADFFHIYTMGVSNLGTLQAEDTQKAKKRQFNKRKMTGKKHEALQRVKRAALAAWDDDDSDNDVLAVPSRAGASTIAHSPS